MNDRNNRNQDYGWEEKDELPKVDREEAAKRLKAKRKEKYRFKNTKTHQLNFRDLVDLDPDVEEFE